MEEKIIEGNKLIAQYDDRMRPEDEDPKHECFIRDGENWFHPSRLQYHTSWDWLMPVVEKIGNRMGLTILGVFNHFNQTQPGFNCEGIEGIWRAVVQQITWDNQTRQP